LYYDANITFRILVKKTLNSGLYGAGHFAGPGVRNKNQEPELSLKFRTGAEAMAI